MTTALQRSIQGRAGAFYRCQDATGCGLRFPVTPGDAFQGRCPRCGGHVVVVATVEPDLVASESASSTATLPKRYFSLLLDNWRSLFNVGAAFRSADGAGADHLYLCGITGSPEAQRKLRKTALGAEQAVAWSYHADAVQLAAKLKAEGAQLWVLERDRQAVNLFDIRSLPGDGHIVLAAGNEVVGVDPGLAAQANRRIQLPMAGSKESLNAAVALSIAAYWLAALEWQGDEAAGAYLLPR